MQILPNTFAGRAMRTFALPLRGRLADKTNKLNVRLFASSFLPDDDDDRPTNSPTHHRKYSSGSINNTRGSG